MPDENLEQLAALLSERNRIDAVIAGVIGRPMTSGHLGEWIAGRVFDIELDLSAVAQAIDGRFRSGAVTGRTVNVKWYLKREGLLDMTQADVLDYYLVLAGPRAAAASSRGSTRAWRMTASTCSTPGRWQLTCWAAGVASAWRRASATTPGTPPRSTRGPTTTCCRSGKTRSTRCGSSPATDLEEDGPDLWTSAAVPVDNCRPGPSSTPASIEVMDGGWMGYALHGR